MIDNSRSVNQDSSGVCDWWQASRCNCMYLNNHDQVKTFIFLILKTAFRVSLWNSALFWVFIQLLEGLLYVNILIAENMSGNMLKTRLFSFSSRDVYSLLSLINITN